MTRETFIYLKEEHLLSTQKCFGERRESILLFRFLCPINTNSREDIFLHNKSG